MNIAVSVRGLTKKIGMKQVLDGLSFDIIQGHVIGLMGPNGAGKSTLLKILMNMCHADAGEVRIFGIPVGAENKKYVSYLPDLNHLFHWMRIRDAINYYRDMFSASGIWIMSSEKPGELLITLNQEKKVLAAICSIIGAITFAAGFFAGSCTLLKSKFEQY